jgi:pimeloyl-ACP methyl ester carboxylesterase
MTFPASVAPASAIHGDAPMASAVPYTEHRISHDGHVIYARDYPGQGPAYVMPHGFQMGDLSVVVDTLKIDKFVPVGHDSGGPCAANYALDNPGRVTWLCLMNNYYAESPTLRFPELIELFAAPSLKGLAKAFTANPDKMAWLLEFQNHGFQVNMPFTLRRALTAFCSRSSMPTSPTGLGRHLRR